MAAGGIDELATALARERRLLEHLLFKLTEARLLLEADEHRFLPWAAAEVERAAHRVRQAELLRASLLPTLGRHETLAGLADASQEPWRLILHEQRAELAQLLRDITAATDANRSLAFDGIRYVGELAEMIELGLGRPAPAETSP
jgi:hypothetical protein